MHFVLLISQQCLKTISPWQCVWDPRAFYVCIYSPILLTLLRNSEVGLGVCVWEFSCVVGGRGWGGERVSPGGEDKLR